MTPVDEFSGYSSDSASDSNGVQFAESGSDGDVTAGEPLFNAQCVSDGPFAGLEVLYFEDIYRPHCLLRGFDKRLVEFRDALRPEALQELLSATDYRSLNLGLENGPHIAIPKSVNGDFSLHSAPADPVFFLHHTQLDRLWWRWQQMDIEARSHEYEGLSATHSEKQATLDDKLHMGGLIPELKVADILRTETEVLCYRY
ncbi:MAG: hypothetical protein OHK93_000082 [Ramalina farinacea]|uniref:Tyrosinase copper-binding domain-containing protein n=1 Tax=Ramalina farinacea TaxID=258253 RepID=A0AA43QE86_9LECA|nr:hypothetical protein [Ramalina farinacea]